MTICENPLWMPKGSVRAILAMIIVSGSMALFALKRLDPETFMMVTAIVVGYSFVSKKE